MEEIMIKDAAKRLGIEAHVLRYWEEELGLEIKRNKMGHRYYDEVDIRLFKEIMKLKEEGLTLKDIKAGIDEVKRRDPSCDIGDSDEEIGSDDATISSDELKVVDFKTAQLQMIMNKLIANALRENKGIITNSFKAEITENVIKQMDVIIKEKEERDEERFKRFDECIRQMQRANEEAAATRSKKLFGRKKNLKFY